MRVACYNILDGGEDRLEQIRTVVHDIQPDFIAILEANDRSNVEWIAKQLDMQLIFGEANNPYHIAWLTAQPVIAHHNHRHEQLEKTLLEIEIDWHGNPVQFFATHLAPGKDDHARRLKETEIILQLVGRRARAPHVLVGDFNALLGSTVIETIERAGFTDCYRATHGATNQNTRPVGDPTLRIDYVFASQSLAGQLRACDMTTSDDAASASDHYPIWAHFTESHG
jgi:endonuclease/exonuclease/phosphatase family metal-dependent hydrolase